MVQNGPTGSNGADGGDEVCIDKQRSCCHDATISVRFVEFPCFKSRKQYVLYSHEKSAQTKEMDLSVVSTACSPTRRALHALTLTLL